MLFISSTRLLFVSINRSLKILSSKLLSISPPTKKYPKTKISDISIEIADFDKALITLHRVHAVLLSEILPTMLIMNELKYVFRVD